MIVCYYEWKDWILHEIIECSTCQLVQLHQILKVCYLSLLPARERDGRGRRDTVIVEDERARGKMGEFENTEEKPGERLGMIHVECTCV